MGREFLRTKKSGRLSVSLDELGDATRSAQLRSRCFAMPAKDNSNTANMHETEQTNPFPKFASIRVHSRLIT